MSTSFTEEFKGTPIFREYLSFQRTNDPKILRFILTFLFFGKKSYVEDRSLNATALRKWRDVENRLSELVLPPWVGNLRPVVNFLTAQWDFDHFLPKHGGGAVSEKGVMGVNMKCWFLRDGVPPGVEWLYGQTAFERDSAMQGQPQRLLEPPTILTESSGDKVFTSRLKFVAKDYKTSRSICMEPTSVMWAQQGVRRVLERAISEGPLSRHVTLKDQSQNQFASFLGSLGFGLDTIDLSSASDSVSWELVKAIFPARILKHLHATRTRTVRINKSAPSVEVKKFAPMGSALCFPTQCIVYSALTLYLGMCEFYQLRWDRPGILAERDIEAYYYQSHDLAGRDSRKMIPFRIYGDDIACDQRVTPSLVIALTSLGFEVNVEKSFMGDSAYRESCGAHHFRGHDVTPFPFKPKQIREKVSMATLAGIIDMANDCLAAGLLTLRKYLIAFITRYDIEGVNKVGKPGNEVNPILFTEDKDTPFAILSANPANAQLQRASQMAKPPRDFKDLQYPDMVRSIALLPRDKAVVYFEDYRYTVWWRSKVAGGGSIATCDVPSDLDTLEVGAKWRWTPIWK